MTTCPKCRAISGDDWTQCKGACPMLCSPHYAHTRDSQEQFRVWPNGTVQQVSTDGGGETEPYSWMSDDFMLVWADDEEEAVRLAGQ